MEFATTEAAWASASGSRPSASIRSMAPWRWAGLTLSRSVRQLSASRTLKKPTGMTCVPRRPEASEDCVPVTSTRPAGPSGQSPSRSVASCRSSRTTSQDWPVAASQLTRRAATDSAVPVGSMPNAATEACTYPESTDARLVAEIQISASMAAGPPQRLRDDHRDLGLAAGAQPVRRALGEGRARHQRQRGSRDERVHDAASGVGSFGVTLGKRRHLAHPESLSRLLSRNSSRGHHSPLPPTIHLVSKTSSEYSINNTRRNRHGALCPYRDLH